MSTSTVAAPPAEPTAPEDPRGRKRPSEPSLHARYVGAMLYFVGAALIAGAVAIVAALTWFGMSAIADSLRTTGHEHIHGTDQGLADEPDDDAPANNAPAEQDAPTVEQDAPAEHGHDSHNH